MYIETITLTIERVLGQFSIRKNSCNGFKHIIFTNHEFKNDAEKFPTGHGWQLWGHQTITVKIDVFL